MIFREVGRFSMPLFLRAAHELVTVDVQIEEKKGNFSRTLFWKSENMLETSKIESIDMNY